MRALLVTPQGVEETEIGYEVEKTRALLKNQPLPRYEDANLQSMYRLIGCDLVTVAGCPDDAHDCWVDEEALLHLANGTQANKVDWYPEILFGKLLITGVDDKGNTTAATMTVEELQSRVKIGALFYG